MNKIKIWLLSLVAHTLSLRPTLGFGIFSNTYHTFSKGICWVVLLWISCFLTISSTTKQWVISPNSWIISSFSWFILQWHTMAPLPSWQHSKECCQFIPQKHFTSLFWIANIFCVSEASVCLLLVSWFAFFFSMHFSLE